MPKKEEEAANLNGAPWVEDEDDTGERTDSTSNSERTVVPGPKETGAKQRTTTPTQRNTATGAELAVPASPKTPTFTCASKSTAKGAHTKLRKKIYSEIKSKGDVDQVAAMVQQLITLGKEIKRQHDLDVAGLGEMTFSDEEEENDWINTINVQHQKCLDDAYQYVSSVDRR